MSLKLPLPSTHVGGNLSSAKEATLPHAWLYGLCRHRGCSPKVFPVSQLFLRLLKLQGSGALWPIDVGTGGLYPSANLSALKRRDSAHLSRPAPRGGRQGATISAAPPPFFAFARAARLCVAAAVFVRYERPVSAVQSSRDAETPGARRCGCRRRGQGWLWRRRSCASSTSLFVRLALYTSIAIMEGAQGRCVSGQWPDPSHTVVRKC